MDDNDAEKVLNFVIRNKDFLAEWEVLRNLEYYSLITQKNLLRIESDNISQGNLFKVWLFNKGELNRVIGSVSLNNIVRGAFQSCHLGYRLDQHAQGQGYMAEALRQIIQYAFNTLKLHRIEANIVPRNRASLRVVEKLNFVHEGLAKKYLKLNGMWEDHIHMVLLNEDLEE